MLSRRYIDSTKWVSTTIKQTSTDLSRPHTHVGIVHRIYKRHFSKPLLSFGTHPIRLRASRPTSTHDVPMAESTLTSAPITPTEEPRCREEDVQLLRAFADVPSVSKGWIFPCREGVRAALQCAGKNLSGNTQRKWLNQFQLNEASLEAGEVETGLPIELTGTTMVSPSPSGGKILMVRPGKNDKTSIVLEVWNRGKLLQEIEVSSEMHGPIYNDGWFGHGAVWSPNETEIAYVAESPVAVRTPNWALAPEERGDVSRTPPATQGVISKSWRGVGEFQDDWGELNTRKRPPAIYVLNIASGKVFAVLGAPEDTSCGQPQWSKAGDALVFVGWSHIHDNFPGFPRRLGMVYCYNRPCSLYAVAWPQPEERDPAIQAYRVTPPHVTSAFSPRFSPDGDTLIFLSQQSAVDSGVHNGTPSLLSLSWGKLVREIFGGSPGDDDVLNAQCLVDVVDLPSSIEDFQGLYCSLLPDFPFICDGSFIVATVQWRSYMAIVAIDVGSGDVSRLSPANGSSWYLVAAGEDWLIASETRPDCPSKLFCCHIAEREKTRPYGWSWSRVGLPDFDDLPKQLEDALNTIDTEVFQVKPTAGDDASRIDFEVVVLRQKNGANASQPGVVVPHGGPHSCYSAIFGMPSFLAACGWCVMLVNYRGSTGFGERFLQSLPGNIGTNDVEDCVAALDLVVGKRYVDASKVAVFGGSHGGFLSAHLVGQYPDRFRAAILRNPVCNISLMVHLSDIPDWCFVEAWGTEQGRQKASASPSIEDLARFMEISPYAHVNKVVAPTLMMLGACDRRVPLEDGKRYIDALKQRQNAPETRMIVFPEDTHALDKPQTEFEQWITALWWLQRHVI